MPIPASVGLYVNWVNGSYSSPTYTAATPDKPNGQTWTKTGSGFSLAVDNDSPWSGQTCVFVTDATNDYINTTVTSAEVSTSGRFFMEGQGRTSGRAQLYIQDNSNPNNAQIIVWSDGSDNLAVRMTWSSATKIAHVALGAFPTDPFKLEVIYDPENASSSLRLRARTWAFGGSAGSFTDTASSTGTAVALSQPTLVQFGDNTDGQLGRLIISNDITEDLSAVSEASSGIAYAFQ